MGLLAPVLGLILFKIYKFGVFTFKETFQYIFLEPGYKMLSAGLSISLLLNALLLRCTSTQKKTKPPKAFCHHAGLWYVHIAGEDFLLIFN